MKVDGGHKRKSNDPECVVEPEQTSDSQDYQGVLSVVVDGQHLLSSQCKKCPELDLSWSLFLVNSLKTFPQAME